MDRVVAALVDEWGVTFEPGGKTVWCRLAVPTWQAVSAPALREHAGDLTPER